MIEVKRKGARSTKDLAPDILIQLNRGEIETENLVEWLAVDQRSLLAHILQQHNRATYLKPILLAIDQLKKQTVNTINEAIGTVLFEQSVKNGDQQFLQVLSYHQADMARCWATYTIGKNEQLTIEQTLEQIKPFSADTHFGVREISWMAVRHKIASNLIPSISILSRWTSHEDKNIRRFSSESTRPRGVWCGHIEILKHNPELALQILEPLKSDPERYVQDSVGNWLNDASKTQADFVRSLCQKWEIESETKETQYIIKKALRTIGA
jgi:3-methyladenine DNA glycosylase AlkC